MKKILVKRVFSSNDIQTCLAIRAEVFIKGQHVPQEEELDGKDDESEHYLLWFDNLPVGVARVRFIEDVAKIERVAVLDEYQGKGLGKKIMEAILIDLKQNPRIHIAKLGAQTYAIPFYEKLGFTVCSDEYLDAGILHKDMALKL